MTKSSMLRMHYMNSMRLTMEKYQEFVYKETSPCNVAPLL